MSKKVAVILSGCGFLDGAEIRESVISLLHLDSQGADVSIFAPNKDQHHSVNHLNQEEAQGKRNILEEAARIARGKISPLDKLKVDSFDALIIPGGFGVAKNLCTFAFEGASGSIDPTIEQVVSNFHSAKKPIGALCIAPALIAMALGKYKVTVTIGNDPETASEIEKTGAHHQDCDADKYVVDKENKIVTTPAYMYDDARLHLISQGVEGCIKETLALI